MTGFDPDQQTKAPNTHPVNHFLGKGTEIEVNINENGITNGAWYAATILECPESSRVLVKYKTLLAEDGLTPLIEHVDHSIIRPLPPDDALDIHCVFEENDVVDAKYGDGWWTGIVNKVVDGVRFTVVFYDPPDVVDFDRSDLRVHFDWVSGSWVRAEKRFDVGMKLPVLDFAPQVHNADDVKASKKRKNPNDWAGRKNMQTVEKSNAKKWRTMHPKVADRIPITLEKVGKENADNKTVTGSSGRRKNVRSQQTVAGSPKISATAIRNLIAAKIDTEVYRRDTTGEATSKKSSGKKGSASPRKTIPRSSKFVETVGKQNTAIEVPEGSNGTRGWRNLSEITSRGPKTWTSGVVKCVTRNCTNESVGNENIENNLDSKITLTSVKSKDIYGGGSAAASESAESKENILLAIVPVAVSEDDQPLSTWFGGLASKKLANTSNELKGESTEMNSTLNAKKAEDVYNGNTSPFIRRSPCWETIEAMEVFQIMPQKPHFSPVIECKDDYREGAAIGLMIAFLSIIEKISSLHFDDARSSFESALNSLQCFEKYGFDISVPRARVIKLLSIKDEQGEILNESEVTEREIKVYADEKRKLDAHVNDIEKKMSKLAEDLEASKSKSEFVDLNLGRLQSRADSMRDLIKTAKLEFEKVTSSPWNLISI